VVWEEVVWEAVTDGVVLVKAWEVDLTVDLAVGVVMAVDSALSKWELMDKIGSMATGNAPHVVTTILPLALNAENAISKDQVAVLTLMEVEALIIKIGRMVIGNVLNVVIITLLLGLFAESVTQRNLTKRIDILVPFNICNYIFISLVKKNY